MHKSIEPAILYFGTPVALISTVNEDGSANLAPMSSVFWLGWRCVLGLSGYAKTTQNLIRECECVVNLPQDSQVAAVDRLARTTGSNPIPQYKQKMGYRFVSKKFQEAGFTTIDSETVSARRVGECPVQLEAVLEESHQLANKDPLLKGAVRCFELRIQRVHVEEALLVSGTENRIDPNKWRPLIMSFQKFYGLGSELYPSSLAKIPEERYRSPDVDRARAS